MRDHNGLSVSLVLAAMAVPLGADAQPGPARPGLPPVTFSERVPLGEAATHVGVQNEPSLLALRALAPGDPRAADVVRNAAASQDERIRAYALDRLVDLRVPGLEQLAVDRAETDPSTLVRMHATAAVVSLRGPRAVDLLAEEVSAETLPAVLKQFARMELCSLDDEVTASGLLSTSAWNEMLSDCPAPTWAKERRATLLSTRHPVHSADEVDEVQPRPREPAWPQNLVDINPLTLLGGILSLEYERAVSPGTSLLIGPQALIFPGPLGAYPSGAWGVGLTGAVHFFPSGEAIHGFWLGPQASAAYVSMSQGSVTASGVGLSFTFILGYTFLLADHLAISLGLGAGYQVVSAVANNSSGGNAVASADGFTLTGRIAIGYAF